MPHRPGSLARVACAVVALIPTGMSAQVPSVAPSAAPVVAQVRGVVFDSVAMTPLAGALVRIVRADDPSVGRSAVTTSSGAFRYDSVPAGVWLASFLHPVLDSLRLEPGIVRLEIGDTVTVTMPLATPSGRALSALSCGAARADDEGVIVGEIRSADTDAPLAGASVEVEWPEWTVGRKSLVTDMVRRRAQSDSSGRYVLCGVPSGSTLRTRSWWQADSAGLIETVVPPSGYAVQDLYIGTRLPAEAAAAATRADSSVVSGGRAIVRGRITTAAGAPLPNASVRVLGSGSSVRSGEDGGYRIVDAAAGTQSLEVRAIGYTPSRRPLRLRTAVETVASVSLATRTVELDTVRVSAGRQVPWDVRAIERRWRTGLGRFLDAKTIADRTSLYVTDALRGMAGVSVRMVERGFGQQVLMRNNRGGDCRASMFVDGVPFNAAGMGGVTLDEFVQAGDVAAVEVYNRPTMVPAEYMTMATDCGVVAVWTKRGTGNVPIVPPKSAR